MPPFATSTDPRTSTLLLRSSQRPACVLSTVLIPLAVDELRSPWVMRLTVCLFTHAGIVGSFSPIRYVHIEWRGRITRLLIRHSHDSLQRGCCGEGVRWRRSLACRGKRRRAVATCMVSSMASCKCGSPFSDLVQTLLTQRTASHRVLLHRRLIYRLSYDTTFLWGNSSAHCSSSPASFTHGLIPNLYRWE